MRFADRRWPEGFGRVQQGEQLHLGLRNLYIVPTRFGGLWLAGAALLQVVGIQTQRNGPLLLSFLMVALVLLALLLSHANLQGLELRCGEPRPGGAGEVLTYPLRLRSNCRREAVTLALQGGERRPPQPVAHGESSVGLHWCSERRGRRRPGPLLIRSSAPLGLFVCWSRWQPSASQVVYPARRRGPVLQVAPADPPPAAGSGSAGGREGSDSWHDLRPQRPEDGSSRLAWKALAQGRGRLSKVFHDPGGEPLLLSAAPGVPRERALEHLCAAVWQHSQGERPYGLLLPEGTIPPGRGREHRERCLLALALTP